MPKRRGGDEDSPASEMQTARGRLKGILQELAGHSEDEDGPSRNSSSSVGPKKKLTKKESPQVPSVQHSYVMKLFDRSVDLAKFDDTTPLYPICRAWIRCNNPQKRTRGYSQKKARQYYEHKVDLLSIIKEDKHREVLVDLLPPPEKKPISRIPDLLPFQVDQDKDNVKIDYDTDAPPMTKEEILEDLKPRWKAVRQNWQEHMHKVENRYAKSLGILNELFRSSITDE
ncbi:protein lin-37 homolog isoform X1 [Lutzomyia longipalpis]|uniref:protein lin-37 homolog isoform X1 n=1 Tax=Lutzomyia longipalpis TaxID=7200 RepID=UPI002484311D|nr:protein lin-37 homolog isoform X1 [Lutzomyia longipalpis]